MTRPTDIGAQWDAENELEELWPAIPQRSDGYDDPADIAAREQDMIDNDGEGIQMPGGYGS